jgi:CTP:molybdopterin cytidylyltransferase MocA
MQDIAILIPAAGASSRMKGRDKLLETVDGLPLLLRQANIALDCGCDVLVTLPPGPNGARRRNVLPQTDRLTVQDIPDAQEGIAASLRAGAAWAQARGVDALMIVLADLPDLRRDDLQRLLRAAANTPGQVVRAVDHTGQHGHPVIIPARLFDALAHLTGDQGARDIIQQEDVAALHLPEDRATIDLDTPEAWARWRARTGR